MATVLGHGTIRHHFVGMHPFFQQTAPSNNTVPDPSAPSLILGLDGASDVDTARDQIGDEKHGCENGLILPNAHPSTKRVSTGESWTISEGDDLEHENDRVKRRKVSPETNRLAHEANGQIHQPTWHDQLEAAAATDGNSNEPISHSEERVSSMQELTLDPYSDLKTSPPRKSRLPVKAPLVTVETDPPPSPTQIPHAYGPLDLDSTTTGKMSSTPKKPLRSGRGKLFFSPNPKKSPRRSPRAAKAQQDGGSVTRKKTPKSAKKVEMKNGKLVSSMKLALSYTRSDSAARIDEILSRTSRQGDEPAAPQPLTSSSTLAAAKTTHPFFLGKAASVAPEASTDLKVLSSSALQTSKDDANPRSSPKPPTKAWKDIVFSSSKASKQTIDLPPAAWPPLEVQHVHPEQRQKHSSLPSTSKTATKSKQSALWVKSEEDILSTFSAGLKHDGSDDMVNMPTRRVMSGDELADAVQSRLVADCAAPPVSALQERIRSTQSNFDKGMASGSQDWCHEYAPKSWQEVLEPQGKVLYDWLSGLRVDHVQSGKVKKSNPLSSRKQRRKRKSDELDDFIADSDDEGDGLGSPGKNAILLVGPPGSGKTASVFAIAQQLDYEVFEIHSGMRRSARDIQDKVGDMTQNHLVQGSSSASMSRESSVSRDDCAAVLSGPPAPNQRTMAAFMSKAKLGKQQKKAAIPESKLKSQKQSLILFEEVDNLFKDDAGFWTHVQWLISNTKRPVVLICNDVDSVPVSDLQLFTVLQYARPAANFAVEHLANIAAAEGHLISKEAIQTLYNGKGRDLRASITELNLWCQMTVGSKLGGLDWMHPHDGSCTTKSDGSVIRIVSENTFTTGLDILPGRLDDLDDMFSFGQNSLNISPLDWVDEHTYAGEANPNSEQTLNNMLIIAEAKSAMDLCDSSAAPRLAGALSRALPAIFPPVSRDGIVRLHLDKLNHVQPDRSAMSGAFDPLLEESRIGLPSAPGRKAASLDNPRSVSIITEVAPYVRSIVAHDRRLALLRNELHGSQQSLNGSNQRQRRTRAARAALEGGNKGTTRRDRWFPDDLDWKAVVLTGGEWPIMRDEDDIYVNGSQGDALSSAIPTPDSTPSPEEDVSTGVVVEV